MYKLCRRMRMECDVTRAETRFRLSAKRTRPFNSAGASGQSTTGSRRVRISGSNAGYTMFRGSVKSTGYPLHSPVSPSLPLLCVTVSHHISTGLYLVCQGSLNFTADFDFRNLKWLYLKWLIVYVSCCFISTNNRLLVVRFEALRYNPEGRGFDSRWCHWNSSLT